MESVCEIATDALPDTREAGAQLRALRRLVQQIAERTGPRHRLGRAPTRSRIWEDQRIVSRPRYRDLIAGLQFVARQELIFGIHVHVGIDDPDKAIHVANGMRVHLPLLLALSANSPFWRGGPDRARSPRARRSSAPSRASGIPPRYDDFDDWSRRIEFMVESRVIGTTPTSGTTCARIRTSAPSRSG